ncbi:hypothetical protein SELMODRAFT_404926 [Selaginella moellendorffii]|uniref:Uncharacterized protein n=1 Tax=Selaginella moellendorffii TaxID=88036 RepID=D8QXU0_SELML|nr:putative lysozyme-like protein [Selaginella moellendorffii]EFJ35480.1 hypothetical protein SELMODRAFT_404926 [Selaginella moellendorffii]|eukprot:XP_002963609.1 putative lysozyme-like protein [Selaginella moellendorffii]
MASPITAKALLLLLAVALLLIPGHGSLGGGPRRFLLSNVSSESTEEQEMDMLGELQSAINASMVELQQATSSISLDSLEASQNQLASAMSIVNTVDQLLYSTLKSSNSSTVSSAKPPTSSVSYGLSSIAEAPEAREGSDSGSDGSSGGGLGGPGGPGGPGGGPGGPGPNGPGGPGGRPGGQSGQPSGQQQLTILGDVQSALNSSSQLVSCMLAASQVQQQLADAVNTLATLESEVTGGGGP